jgi:hypothetical protein
MDRDWVLEFVDTHGGLEKGAIAPFAIDPGGTTGWVWGIVPLQWLMVGVADAVHVCMENDWIRWGQIETRMQLAGNDVHPLIQEADHANQVWRMVQLSRRKAGGVSAGGSLTDVVVIEDFLPRQRTLRRDSLSPVRVTAGIAMRATIDSNRLYHMFMQSPSDRMVIKPELLKTLRLWCRGEPHARDAAQHWLLFLRRFAKELRLAFE